MRDCFNRWGSLVVCFLGSLASLSTQASDSLTFTTLAGSAGSVVNSIDATGSAAQFSAPRGIAVDISGNVYVADSSNHTIRKVTAAGVVTTLAGSAGTTGRVGATPARFSEPFGVATDIMGNVYVADTNNNAIRRITPAGVVATLAGGNGMGSTDGTGTNAKFAEPHGVAVDSNGNVFVSDFMNSTVRKVTPAGEVTTIAGSAGSSGFVNGTGSAARFKSLQGIAVDTVGNLYVADSGNRAVRKITPSGVVSTLVDGTNGQLGSPRGVVVDSTGTIYVTDYSAHVIYQVTSAGAVSTLAGTAPSPGSTDGATSVALFNAPSAVAIDNANNLYVADTANNTVRKIASGNVTTLAGLAGRSSSMDGVGAAARFEDPYAVAVDAAGIVYVADATDHSIRKITPDGTVTTVAGRPGTFGSSDGTGSAALFKNPLGIATDGAGNVYIADTGNAIIRKVTSTGVVTTLAGSAGALGNTDAIGSAARFSSPYGITADSAGNLYVVDSIGNTVRKITADGVVTTLAGSPGLRGLIDGTGADARFSVPFDIAVGPAGELYVCDHGNHAIRKVTAAGVVTTLAGSGSPGSADGSGTAALFKFPSGISVDAAGNVYVADTDNQVIRKISPAGVVASIAGSSIGSTDGAQATFYNPKDVAVGNNGEVYVADRGNHTIRKGSVVFAASRLVNISTRGQVSTGDKVLIGGFIISGASAKKVLIRAVGPNLTNYSVTGVLANPMIELHRSTDGAIIASNDDWGRSSNASEITATNLAPVDPKEAAILATLDPGAYTAIVTGNGGGTGVGIVEVFEMDHPETPLINISTRGSILTGDQVLIGGLIIQGDAPQAVLIRAVGPTLTRYGVSGTIANPTLELHQSSDGSIVASNDDWGSAANAAAIMATGLAPEDTAESAILITLQPGAYTAIVSGKNGGTGVGLVEVFAQ